MPKYCYIHNELGEVLTLAYEVHGDDLAFGWAMSRHCWAKMTRLDQRIREVMGDDDFRWLQQEFNRRFRGDQHNKKIARAISSGRLEKTPIIISIGGQRYLQALVSYLLCQIDQDSGCPWRKWKDNLQTELRQEKALIQLTAPITGPVDDRQDKTR